MKRVIAGVFFLLAFFLYAQLNRTQENISLPTEKENSMANIDEKDLKIATLGGGCFWCVEAVFERVEGIYSAVSGYSGGRTEKPTYTEVSSGITDHAEVVQIKYDPKIISYEEILELFWKAHDPTTLNQQGADIGTQYRSIILFHDEEQRQIAEKMKSDLDKSGTFKKKVVTEIVPFFIFYPAEEYHQDYYARNPYAGYCIAVINPKLEKLGFEFKER